MKRSRIKPYSLNKIAELDAETPIREQLCIRAHGTPRKWEQIVHRDGKRFLIHRVTCLGAICECGCGEFSRQVDPHEKHSRGQGGKLSLENSIMVKRSHHPIVQNSYPMWSKK